MSDLVIVQDVAGAKSAIDLIKQQGEGTSTSPFADGNRTRIAPVHELAHYYRFGEIHAERRLRPDSASSTGWSFSGDPFLFPVAQDLFLMAEVPPGGYPESKDFDRVYTDVLKLLHDAWAQGNKTKLGSAIDTMDAELTDAAIALLNHGYAAPGGAGIKGPDFRFLPR